VAAKAEAIATALRSEHLGQPAVITAAYAATVRAQVAILTTLNTEINTSGGVTIQVVGVSDQGWWIWLG
jgi:hypothetical protein